MDEEFIQVRVRRTTKQALEAWIARASKSVQGAEVARARSGWTKLSVDAAILLLINRDNGRAEARKRAESKKRSTATKGVSE